MKQAIHISDLKSFIECRRKWDWSSLMRQGLERVAPYAPFSRVGRSTGAYNNTMRRN